jgi:hypothetical protein
MSAAIQNAHVVWMGRGGGCEKGYDSPGNVCVHDLVRMYFLDYTRAARNDKTKVSQKVLSELKGLHPPVRFLKQDGTEVNEEKACKRISECFRALSRASSARVAVQQSLLKVPRSQAPSRHVDERETQAKSTAMATAAESTHVVWIGRRGAGDKGYNSPGNKCLRDLARMYLPDYTRARRNYKANLARKVLRELKGLEPPVRFLKPNGTEVGEEKACKRISECFRALRDSPA